MSPDIFDTNVFSQEEFLDNYESIIEDITNTDEPVRILTDNGYTLILAPLKEFIKEKNEPEEDE